MSSEGLVDSLAQHANTLSRAKFRRGNDFALTLRGIRLGPEPLLETRICDLNHRKRRPRSGSSANGV